MYICLCNGISDRDIHGAVEQGLTEFDDLKSSLGVASCCGRCECAARNVHEQAVGVVAESSLDEAA